MLRKKAAICLAVLYACVMLAPHAALAFNAAGFMHCINDVVAVSEHAHEHGAPAKPHAHGKADMDRNHAGKAADSANPPVACCGLFAIAAIPLDLSVAFGVAPRVSAILPMPAERLDGEGPGHINKPPRA